MGLLNPCHNRKCYHNHLFVANQKVRIEVVRIFYQISLFLQTIAKIYLLLMNVILPEYHEEQVEHLLHKTVNNITG